MCAGHAIFIWVRWESPALIGEREISKSVKRYGSATMTTFRRFLKTLTKFADALPRKWGAARVLCMQTLNPLAEAVSNAANGNRCPGYRRKVQCDQRTWQCRGRGTRRKRKFSGVISADGATSRFLATYWDTRTHPKTTWAGPCVHCRIRAQFATNREGSRTPFAIAQ